jgi:hypothetical protein
VVFVIEQVSPWGQRRWYSERREFDDVDDAVAVRLAQVPTVIVRTLGDQYYWAGREPDRWNPSAGPLRPWPPSRAERRAIDLAWERELAAAEAEAAAQATYESDRGELGSPLHTCRVTLPDGEGAIELDELMSDASICGARRTGSDLRAFGTLDEVMSITSGRPRDDAWLSAVIGALCRDRTWTPRRGALLVKRGGDPMFHLTPAANRESIEEHGLDWNRMGATVGIAGSPAPELPVVFLCESRFDVDFFRGMARGPVDVWSVAVDGFWLEGDPNSDLGAGDNWMLVPHAIDRERLTLVDRDLPSLRHRRHD